MQKESGDSGPVLPWLLIRQDGHGNRYRVGSYGTRSEAERIADRLAAGTATVSSTGPDRYLVESRDHGCGTRG
jgi:hypothetical protein